MSKCITKLLGEPHPVVRSLVLAPLMPMHVAAGAAPGAVMVEYSRRRRSLVGLKIMAVTAGAILKAGDADTLGFERRFVSKTDLAESPGRDLPLQASGRGTRFGGAAPGDADLPACGETAASA